MDLGDRMKVKDVSMYKLGDVIFCICDSCNCGFKRTKKGVIDSRKRWGKNLDYCNSCACKKSIDKKPQCSKEFWDNDYRRKMHSESIKASAKYYEAIKRRDQSGERNGMYGKKMSKETITKMIKSRTGKTRKKEHKTTLNRRVKGYLHKTINWYFKTYQRDGFKCVECSSINKIDAHHIKPLSLIIKEKLKGKNFSNDNERYLFLINDPDIIDIELKNSITLCRKCHKIKHKNWGSHNAR